MTAEIQERYRRIRNILIWILFLNWLVAVAKIIYGVITSCKSMSADGFHSLSDGASNIICLIGINLACKPRDSDHPYGHGKYETLFSLGIAGLLFLVAFNIAREGVTHLFRPNYPRVDFISFAVMLVTMAINIAVMKYEYRQGKILQSELLVSDSLHTRADILTSLSVLVTLVFIKLGFPRLDSVVSIAIAFFIAYAAFEITRSSSNVLCDTAVIVDLKKVTDIVMRIEGVLACHKIRTRGRPDDINIDLHVQVAPDMHMDKAHRISYQIEDAIRKELPQVTDVLVHLEPKGRPRQE
jgi:cation diffusion facilitator family transporter